MKLIINASNLCTTGVIQVATSFIHECLKFDQNEYFIFTSNILSSQLNYSQFSKNFTFYQIPKHPLYGISGFKMRRLLRGLEKMIAPDCVFTIFGPSWWTPKLPHIMGYAIAHYLYPKSPLYGILSLAKRLRIHIYKIFHRYYFNKNGEYYICETEDGSIRLRNFLHCKEDHVFTVTNTCSEYFNTFYPSEKHFLNPKKPDEFRFVTLSSFVTHKNITILNEVIPLLRGKMKDIVVVFVLTVDEIILRQKITKEARRNIINLGRLPVSACPGVYYECDALFLPTLMECFSANFPEAMKMKKPILTSDLPFCTAVCKDAALYFDPLNPEDIAEKIIELIGNRNLQMSLIEKGERRLMEFDTAEIRAEKYLRICKSISSKHV